jgi:hypothetical protein
MLAGHVVVRSMCGAADLPARAAQAHTADASDAVHTADASYARRAAAATYAAHAGDASSDRKAAQYERAARHGDAASAQRRPGHCDARVSERAAGDRHAASGPHASRQEQAVPALS